MSTAEPRLLSPRAMAWSRRGRSLAEFCREFSHQRAGMVGLVFLIRARRRPAVASQIAA